MCLPLQHTHTVTGHHLPPQVISCRHGVQLAFQMWLDSNSSGLCLPAMLVRAAGSCRPIPSGEHRCPFLLFPGRESAPALWFCWLPSSTQPNSILVELGSLELPTRQLWGGGLLLFQPDFVGAQASPLRGLPYCQTN